MKIAVAVFNNVVAPRADIADEVFIYEVKNKKIIKKVNYKIFLDAGCYFYSLVKNLKVNKFICGSYPHMILNMLQSNGTEVYMNSMGDPDEVVKRFLDKKPSSVIADNNKRLQNRRSMDRVKKAIHSTRNKFDEKLGGKK